MTHNIAITNKGLHDLNPINCGYADCPAGTRQGPHIRDYFLLHHVTSGKGVLTTASSTFRIQKGDSFLIRAHEMASYAPDNQDPWSYIWIGFTGELAERLAHLVNPIVQLPANLFQEIVSSESLESMREEYLTGKLFLIYSVIFADEKPKSDYVRQVCNYIDANYMYQFQLSSMAKLAGIDRTYLARLFKQRMGISMQQYLIQTRLWHAAKLLSEGYRVAEASLLTGYEDSFNFSKIFKKYYGLSPQEYKTKMKR